MEDVNWKDKIFFELQFLKVLPDKVISSTSP